MASELKDDATHEEIEQYVDEAIKNVEQDREGQPTDGETVAAGNDTPVGDMTAEDTGSDDTDVEEPVEETGDSEAEPQWLDDDLKAEVAAFGIKEAELAEFSSREELERAMRLFDRTALEAGRKAMADGTEKEEEKVAPPPADVEGQYQVQLSDEVYEDDLIQEFNRMRDHYESRIESLESQFEAITARAEEQQFDALVDSLGHSDLFGKTGKENSKQLQRRKDLHVAVKAQQIGLKSFGVDVEMDEALINRVAKMAFAEELDKKQWKAKTRKVSKQSQSRQGGGQTRPQDPKETLREEARRLYKELEGA